MSKFGITQKMTIRHRIPISSWKSLSRFIDKEMLQHQALLRNGCIFNENKQSLTFRLLSAGIQLPYSLLLKTPKQIQQDF